MKDFKTFKAEILRRAKEAIACTSQYKLAYESETYAELMQVIKDNFWWCCYRNIIDEKFINEYKDEFNNNDIFCNESRYIGYLLVTDKVDKIGGDCEAVIMGNAVVNKVCDDALIEGVFDNATVYNVYGNAYIDKVFGSACIDCIADNARIYNVSDNAVIEKVFGNAVIYKVFDNAVIEKVFGNAVIYKVFDNAKILHDYR